jgi:hypothetical protein
MTTFWMDPYGRRLFGIEAETDGMTTPVRCRCGRVYDLGKVTVEARYTDCSMWRTPCCKVLADDRKPPWGISWYEELPRRDRAFPEEDRCDKALDTASEVCPRCFRQHTWLTGD